MKKKNTDKLFIFLQRNQMSLYCVGSSDIVSFPFDPALVNDLEILDDEKFKQAIGTFINQQKYSGGEAIVLLDNSVYFTQKVSPELPAQTQDTQDPASNHNLIEKANKAEEEKVQFMHSMPFSNAFATVLTIGKEKIIFGLNRDFYEPIIKEFTDRDFEVKYIFPLLVVADMFAAGLTPVTATAFVQSVEKYRAFNFLQASLRKEGMVAPPSTIMPETGDRKRMYLLIGVFTLLLLVLGGVIWWSSKQNDTPPKPAPVVESVSPPAPTPTPIPTESTAPTTETAAPATLAIVIRNGSGSESAGSAVLESLKALGFANAQLITVPTQTDTSTVVVVKPSVPSSVRQQIQDELVNSGYTVVFKESPEVTDDISINLASK